MKIIRYRYIDGNNMPSDIIKGGFFYHIVNGEPFLIGFVDDNNNNYTEVNSDYILNLIPNYTINPITKLEEPVDKNKVLNDFLSLGGL